jgi:hypothetical protein
LSWRWLLALFVLVAVVHGLSPDVQVSDSRMSVPTSYAVIHHGTLSLDGIPSVKAATAQTSYDVTHHDGKLLPFLPWPPMLLAVPATAVAGAVGVDVPALRLSQPNRTWPIEVATAALLVAAAAVVMALIAAELVDDDRRGRGFSVAVALIFAFATAAWSTASRALWQHTPALLLACLVLLAALRARRDVRYLWLLGAALALGYTMRPTVAVEVVVIGVWALLVFRRDAWRAVVAGVVVAVAFVAVNLAEYGSVLAPYYHNVVSGASYGFWESLGVQLVSPSRGLLVYTPLFLLVPVGLWLKRRSGHLTRLDVAVTVVVLAQIVVVSRSGSTGGTAYGNRLFTEIVPYLLYLCLPVFERLLVARDLRRSASIGVAALVILSVVLTVPGAVSHAALCWSTEPRVLDDAPQRVWDWRDPQFLRPVGRLEAGASLHDVIVGSCRPSPAAGKS